MSGIVRKLQKILKSLLVTGLILAIALGLVGQLVRDRSVILALFMYLPLPLIGLIAIGVDAIYRGQAVPKGRFVLGSLGLIALIGSSLPMIGFGPGSRAGGGGVEISLLHWNVYWGGGRPSEPTRWASIRREILSHPADLVVLSEAPGGGWIDQLVTDLGPGANRVQVEHVPGSTDWYRLVVCSKGPLRLVRSEKFTDGVGMVVEAEVRGRLVRLLVVDARSNPLLPRSPRLNEIAAICRSARASGEPIDLIVGDFNTIARSLGFDAIEAEGYALASRSSKDWRGTFPSLLPVYDIDHVWVGSQFTVMESHLFTNLASDHRGQVARFVARD